MERFSIGSVTGALIARLTEAARAAIAKNFVFEGSVGVSDGRSAD